MSPAVARAAELPGNKTPEVIPTKVDSVPNAKCIRQPVPVAVQRLKFRLSPAVIGRFIAEIVFLAREAINFGKHQC